MSFENFKFYKPQFDKELSFCEEFLNNYEDDTMEPHPTWGRKKYLVQLQRIVNGGQKIMEIHTEDLEAFFDGNEHKAFLMNLKKNSKRYVELFSEAADKISIQKDTESDQKEEFDNALEQFRMNALQGSAAEEQGKAGKLLNLLKRKFELVITPGPNSKKHPLKLRELKSDRIGSLVETRAMVVRVSEVKPVIKIACYLCEVCGFEIYQKVNSKDYTPIVECPSSTCKHNSSKGRIIPNFAVSKFEPFQEIKVQETTDQTPMGSIPRTYTVYARGSMTRQCVPGDIINVSGVFLPNPPDKKKRFRDALIHNTHIEAYKIEQEKKTFENTNLDQYTLDEIKACSKQPGIYQKLARSICPEIWGMEDVKKALLLMMIGGSTITMADGMKIRGDLNMALIGDPGVAKSQLLKHIAHITPRGIYTTGKGSSGAGLTAAVLKDQMTNEVVLEGGALVLSDMGVCCIDEFDKMDERDRTSIHEVMEQQTVSIAKAGITTTLNARTSILAAANPVWGRYNKNRSPHENINLAPSLLSRFDLIFILLDRPDQVKDDLMAKHITYVHQNKTYPKTETTNVFDTNFLRNYVAHAKSFNPTIPTPLHNYLIKKYIEKRGNNSEGQSQTTYSYTTPRTLLAVIRLAQALCKLRLSDKVSQEDIDEALTLMSESQRSIIDTDKETGIKKHKKDSISMIFDVLKNQCSAKGTIAYDDLEKKVIGKGYSASDLKKCVDQYSEMDVIIYDKDDGTITLVE